MPRGVPNIKRDDYGMRYTSFHVPLAPNPKQQGATYLKSDSQSLWTRNALRRRDMQTDEPAAPQEQRRGSQVIVIHPGSRFIRIGKACDVNPVSVPNVIARKSTVPVPEPVYSESISRPSTSTDATGDARASSEDAFEKKLAAISSSLRDRMRFYKYRVTPNAATIASHFNQPFIPEVIADHNDAFRVEWIDETCSEDVLIGDKISRLADPSSAKYTIRYPIHSTNFNTRDYPSLQVILSDLETTIRETLQNKFKLGSKDLKEYSVVLVIPDFYDRSYVHHWVQLLLVTLGFKQLCVQQESLAATYGAGISNACVVDIGAVSTSVTCVDEGLVIPETRMVLNIGGNDITELLYVLLARIKFPYRDINLARTYDWQVMEDLKFRLCTLQESDVALNLYDFTARRPGRAEKFGLRAYDEIILAPMCLFEPRIIDFDKKRSGFKRPSSAQITDEIIEQAADQVTLAMTISTQHLMPDPELPPPDAEPTEPLGGAFTPNGPVGESTEEGSAPSEAPADTPMDIDVENDSKPAPPARSNAENSGTTSQHEDAPPSNFSPIDVFFEASKLPLDVAIFNSARAAGGDEKIRKYLQAVLVIGGTSLIPGMNHALESRLQAIATPLVPNMDKVQIIPPPKEVDPRVLAWKGAAVLGKMDGVTDLWITPSDWDILGMRGLKERCFYL